MKPITSKEQALKNAERFTHLLAEANISQAQAAKLIAEQTLRSCSARTVRSGLNDPEKDSWRPCPDWAVIALQARLLTLQLMQR